MEDNKFLDGGIVEGIKNDDSPMTGGEVILSDGSTVRFGDRVMVGNEEYTVSESGTTLAPVDPIAEAMIMKAYFKLEFDRLPASVKQQRMDYLKLVSKEHFRRMSFKR